MNPVKTLFFWFLFTEFADANVIPKSFRGRREVAPSDGKTSVDSDSVYVFLYNLTKEDLIRRHIKELKKSIKKPENTAVAEVMAVSNETTTTIDNKNTSTKQLGGGHSQLCFLARSFHQHFRKQWLGSFGNLY